MTFITAIHKLNKLKQQKVFGDFAIYGAVAFGIRSEPIQTEDLDVLVLAETDADYIEVYRALETKFTRTGNWRFLIEGVPVEIFPTSNSPLHHDALKTATYVNVEGQRAKVVRSEYLILLALIRYSVRDRIRIAALLENLKVVTIDDLVERYDDDDKTLSRNWQNFKLYLG